MRCNLSGLHISLKAVLLTIKTHQPSVTPMINPSWLDAFALLVQQIMATDRVTPRLTSGSNKKEWAEGRKNGVPIPSATVSVGHGIRELQPRQKQWTVSGKGGAIFGGKREGRGDAHRIGCRIVILTLRDLGQFGG